MLTILSITVKKYFKATGDEKTDNILIMVPVNVRERPDNLESFEFCNKFVIFPVLLPLSTDFEACLK